jgi:hypothetical protein
MEYTPTEVLEWFRVWLIHPTRERSKFTDVVMAVLTLLIAGSAIYSAWVFQAQLTETRITFHIDQRAWLGPTEALPPQFTENGQPVYIKAEEQSVFQVFLANSGKTPAKNIDQQVSFRTLPAVVPFSPKYPTGPERIGVIQPGSKFRWATSPTEKANETQVGTYRSGANILYFFGEITYDDIFGDARHHTRFCMYLLKDLSTFVDCKTYSDAD